MEVPFVEYRETFEKEHFCKKITSILNTLEVGETGYYKIGYADDQSIKPLSDVEKTFEMVKKTLDEITNSSQNPDSVIISPDPLKYLQPVKEANTVIIKIQGNVQKPYFYQGNLCVRRDREKTVSLRRQQDILAFIEKSSNYQLLNDPVLIEWKRFMCDVFLLENMTVANFKLLSERRKNGRYATRQELNSLNRLYDFIKSAEWFDTDEDQAAKIGLLKILESTEQFLNRTDRMTKQPIALRENFRLFIFSDCTGCDPNTGVGVSNPSSRKFSGPGYYRYGDERRSLVKLLEMLFEKK